MGKEVGLNGGDNPNSCVYALFHPQEGDIFALFKDFGNAPVRAKVFWCMVVHVFSTLTFFILIESVTTTIITHAILIVFHLCVQWLSALHDRLENV